MSEMPGTAVVESGEPASTAFDQLIPGHQTFVLEYLKDCNATRAAIRAGYSRQNASSIAYQMLQRPDIKVALDEVRKSLSDELKLDAVMVLKELAIVAFSDIANYTFDPETGDLDLSAQDAHISRAIANVKRTTRRTAPRHASRLPGKKNGEEATEQGLPQEVTVEIRLYDKLQALKLLGEHLGLFEAVQQGILGPGVLVISGVDVGLALGGKRGEVTKEDGSALEPPHGT